ncbi:hypothetical protein MSG28_009427 [Choristoneura fumiferana]|uniref:Uncharacterized protein n=1 Tax=Choristoneura fumiferana TaxID=7141 RepID=A0ACC0KYE1_CHOFU|nr:hypothetical protein MSG28_009427 [Choristoneura fumiferana]
MAFAINGDLEVTDSRRTSPSQSLALGTIGDKRDLSQHGMRQLTDDSDGQTEYRRTRMQATGFGSRRNCQVLLW